MQQVRSCALAVVLFAVAAISVIFTMPTTTVAQRAAATPPSNAAWNDKTLPPDTRADLVMHEMTTAEKFQLVHGTGWGVLKAGSPVPAASNHGAGYMPGILRLGI